MAVNLTLSFAVTNEDDTPIATGRTDIACHSCGTWARVKEDLMVYADGNGKPLSWDSTSSTTTEITAAKELGFAASLRDRLFLFGEEPYRTGNVDTFSGSKEIERSDGTTWPAAVAGKSISISNTSFGVDSACQARILSVSGPVAILDVGPNDNLVSASFVVHGGTEGSTLQWSDSNDHTTYTDTEIGVGRLDGDVATGITVLADSIVLFKRQRAYRFDFGDSPSTDSILRELFETRGLIAHKCAVVVEGQAYCMDRFPGSYFYTTRGARLFPSNIGSAIADIIEPGGEYELDWVNSACWFGWYSPHSNSICWAVSRKGEPYPDICLEYLRPNVEGGDEPARWSIREYDHYLVSTAGTIPGHDGFPRAILMVADKDKVTRQWLVADGNAIGDMATVTASGTVAEQISPTVYDLALDGDTEFNRGQIVEINGETRTVESQDADTDYITFSKGFSTDVEGQDWRSGWRPFVTFKTIGIRNEPPGERVKVANAHLDFDNVTGQGIIEVSMHSDLGEEEVDWYAAEAIEGTRLNYRLVAQTQGRVLPFSPGTEGHYVQITIGILTPGDDKLESAYLKVLKRSEDMSGPEMRW